MTIFSDEVLMLAAAEMEEWYERELILRAENELRQRRIPMRGGTPGLDSATTAWIGAVVLNGGTVSRARSLLVNNLMVSLKQGLIFSTLDRLWLLAAENTTSALTDLIGANAAVVHGSPIFTVDRGFTGQDSAAPTSFIDTQYNPASSAVNYTLNSAQMSIWNVTNNAAVNGGAVAGATDAGNESTNIYDTFTDGNVYARINDNPESANQGAPTSRTGHWLINRSSSSATQLFRNATLFSNPNGATVSIVNNNLLILAKNTIGGAHDGTPNQIAMMAVGGGLSSSNVTIFFNAIRAYMTGVGVP